MKIFFLLTFCTTAQHGEEANFVASIGVDLHCAALCLDSGPALAMLSPWPRAHDGEGTRAFLSWICLTISALWIEIRVYLIYIEH